MNTYISSLTFISFFIFLSSLAMNKSDELRVNVCFKSQQSEECAQMREIKELLQQETELKIEADRIAQEIARDNLSPTQKEQKLAHALQLNRQCTKILQEIVSKGTALLEETRK